MDRSSANTGDIARSNPSRDIAGLAVFRVLFGAVMFLHGLTYSTSILLRYIRGESAFQFKYLGFFWVQPLPPELLQVVLALHTTTAFLVMAGLFYRASCLALCLTHCYIFLLDASDYLNHAYLMCLLAGLMAFVPANGALSADAWRRPGLANHRVASWCPALLQFQIAVVYLYGGIAKLNSDWLSGEPMRHWLLSDTSILGSELCVRTICYGGIAFDLLVVPLLCWRRTRALALIASAFFHISNTLLFNIGMFPWLMLAATTLFLPGSWPRQLPGLRRLFPTPPDVGLAISRPSARCTWLLAAYATLQILLPLRHLLYPGPVAWTEEGHMFSWRMMLRDKRGQLHFVVTSDEQSTRVFPSARLSLRQQRKIVGRPELIRQYAVYLGDEYRDRWHTAVQVRAMSEVQLNFAAPRPLIRGGVDLARAEPSLFAYAWILPRCVR